jgi:hypothetical protein
MTKNNWLRRRPTDEATAGVWKTGGHLTEHEKEMLGCADSGKRLDLGAGPFDLQAMRAWTAVRTIRASVLRHLVVEQQWPVHAKGVHLYGVRISGLLDLEAATVHCALRLENCFLDSPEMVNLDYATVSVPILDGCRLGGLTGDTLIATKELDLSRSIFTGLLRLRSAEISGGLNCNGAQLCGSDPRGNSLAADLMKVTGKVSLSEGFIAEGAIRLPGAEIAGQFDCRGAELKGADADGDALIADRIKVGAGVFFENISSAIGAIWMPGADISGELSFRNATLNGIDSIGSSLVADGVNVTADVFLDGGFKAANTVSLRSACIGGSLRLTETTLAQDKTTTALDAGGAHITHELQWSPCKQVVGRVSLQDAAVGQLEDDWTLERRQANGYWPSAEQGGLNLDGFTYTRMIGEGGADVRERLEWIRSQYRPRPLASRTDSLDARVPPRPRTSDKGRASFTAQPYQQLETVYRQAGQDREARRVAIARRRDLRRFGDLTWYRRAGNRFLDITILYGYQTWRVVAVLAALYTAVLLLFWYAQHQAGLIVPAQDITSLRSMPTAAGCVSGYPCFSPIGYALDTVIPIINVHQADYWRPNPGAPDGWFYEYVNWASIVLGWALATLTVAGYTGLVRSTDAP